jgi:hypothetical protein
MVAAEAQRGHPAIPYSSVGTEARMDGSQFDTLARAFATTGTRRWLVRLVAALPLGGALTTLGQDEAAAERPHERLARRTQQRNRKQRTQRQQNQNQNNNDGGGGNGGGGGGGNGGGGGGNGGGGNNNNNNNNNRNGNTLGSGHNPPPGPSTCANATSFCDPDESPCGGADSDCKCVPTMSGGSLCVFSIRCPPDQTICQTDVDCRFPGEVCIPPAATTGCSFQCGGNGNACATPC